MKLHRLISSCALLAMALAFMPAQAHPEPSTKVFYTTAGPLTEDKVGNIMAHQHMFVEFGAKPPVKYLKSTPEEVYKVIGPLVLEAKSLGYTVFVDPTPEGTGFRPDIVKYVANKAGMPAMMVAGLYSDPYLPTWVETASVDQIAKWFRKQLDKGIGKTGVRAGFIKLSQSTEGISTKEMKVLKAACIASKATGASIGSHILSGATALAVINALEGFGCDPHRFIWIHAPYTAFTEKDGPESVLAAAKKGAYISADFISSGFWAAWLEGKNGDERHLALIKRLVDAGYEDQIIIGTDTGWYDPGFPKGFVVEGYGGIVNSFLPAMKTAGFSETVIRKLMHSNPWNAYSR